jgi:crotonobetainyl-CoA:carnitine CoA-transferase CaiB-like acyl-CoA transferase
MSDGPAPSPPSLPSSPSPLAGLRVLDLSRVLAGPLATMTLGDLGADVVKVERPGGGDDTRAWGPPFVGPDAAYFLCLNRNKRSAVVDLRTPEGVRAIERLSRSADVVIENFRPGLMAELGLELAELRAANPRLVTCSLSAFGEGTDQDEGDAATRPGYDIIVQALCGLMSVTGEPDGEPVKAGVALLDVVTGLHATIGILAALAERGRTGRGRHVSVSLFDASVAAMVNQAANTLMGGVEPKRLGTAHPNIVPYQAFRASDRAFVVAGGNDRLFGRICEIVGAPAWAVDERFATNRARVEHRDDLVPMLQTRFAARAAEAWLDDLTAAGVPCAPIRTMAEVFASPEGAALVEMVEDPNRAGSLRLVAGPILFDGMRLPTRLPPPLLGAETGEVLER